MRVLNHRLMPLWFTLALAAVAIAIILLAALGSCPAHAAEAPNEFIKGYDYGKSFLGPKKKKGKKYRKGINKQVVRFKPWLRRYMRNEVVQAGSRAHLESRGNWWSHTKDETIYEAGLMSNGYDFTRMVCLEHGVCGDPCGDPHFSIALAGYRRYLQRSEMFYGDGFWKDWLLEQAESNQFEAECFIGACGSVNCQKVRMAIIYSGVHENSKLSKDGKLHRWWKLMNYLREQSQDKIAKIFYPKENLWRIGTRLGRVVAGKFMQAEFFVEPETGNGHEPRPNFCWGGELVYYPHEAGKPIFPEPLYPTGPKFMKFEDWRKRCVFYGTKAWKKATGEPKRNDRWKKAGMRYHPITEEPINVKKGQKKYANDEEFEQAHAAWVDKMQDEGVLPTDAEYAAVELEMYAAGCQMRNPVEGG